MFFSKNLHRVRNVPIKFSHDESEPYTHFIFLFHDNTPEQRSINQLVLRQQTPLSCLYRLRQSSDCSTTYTRSGRVHAFVCQQAAPALCRSLPHPQKRIPL